MAATKTIKTADNAGVNTVTDNGDGTGYVNVGLGGGDIEIGAVELKNGADDTRAKVGVGTAIVEGDNALAVKDPVTGATTGAAVTTDANGTIQQYLRGLIKLLVNGALSLVKANAVGWTSADVGVTPLAVRNNTHSDGFGAANAAYTPFAVDGTGKLGIRGTYAEDEASAGGDLGLMVLGVNNSADAAFNSTAGDYTPIQVDNGGNVSTKDRGPAWTTVFGVTGAVFTSADATTAVAITAAPVSTMKLVITDLIISTDTAMFMLFQEETSLTTVLKIFLPANGTVQITPRGKLKLATADKKLLVDASTAGNIAITALYTSEA